MRAILVSLMLVAMVAMGIAAPPPATASVEQATYMMHRNVGGTDIVNGEKRPAMKIFDALR